MSYAVLLRDNAPLNLEVLKPILARISGWTVADAARAVRRCRGIVCENISLEDAQRIGSAVEDAGVPVFLMRTQEMIAVPRERTIHNADCFENGFHLVEPNGAKTVVPWTSVIGVFVGTVRTKVRKREVRGRPGRYAGSARAPISVSPSVEVSFRSVDGSVDICDVVTSKPPGRFRFERTALNYDYLGDRLSQDTQANFSMFIADILRLSPGAVANDGAGLFGRNPTDPGLRYDDEAAFDEEARWRLNRALVGA